jgi:hypothetical protein
MTSPVALTASWILEPTWMIPVIGVFVTCAAFVWGHRLLPSRKQPTPPSPQPEPEDRVFLHGTTLERRAVPRRAGNAIGVLIAEKPPEPALQGWVMNRSTGGLALLVTQPLKEGLLVHVRPQTPQGSPPWIAMEVRNCHAEAGDWIVNCQFLKTPEYSTLLLFG